MTLWELCFGASFAYQLWAFSSSSDFHRLNSFSLFITCLLWTADSIFLNTVFYINLILCIILSPLQVVTSAWWTLTEPDDSDPVERSIQELLPKNESNLRHHQFLDVDIVAVHGLGSHSIRAWTSTIGDDGAEPVLWLRDFLLKETDFKPRVLTFNHDSQWLRKANNKPLSVHGDDLLRAIRRKRKTIEEQNRPLILIGHSFGGLVIKQMLVNAKKDSHNPQNKLVLETTRGLIFMGTPHKGARRTTFGRLWALLSHWQGSSTALLDYLVPDSKPNNDMHEDFMGLLPDICSIRKTLCIYETAPQMMMGIPITEIVSRDSAVIAGAEKIAMSKEHRQMQRFPSPEDDTYQDIVRYIQAWIFNDEKTVEDKGILLALSFPMMLERHDQITKPHANTCQWILELEEFQAWLQGQYKVLWIKGHPGSGKSTTIASTVEHLEHNSRLKAWAVLQFYFNGRSKGVADSLEGLLRSLLHQIYDQIPQIRGSIRQSLKSKGVADPSNHGGLKWQRRQLSDTFLDAVKNLKALKLLIFIDALDEAKEEEIGPITSFLNDIGKVSEDIDWRPRICISCRRYPVVARIPGPEILIENHNDKDVITFLRDSLDSKELPNGWRLNQVEWKHIVEELAQKASSSFQWAALVTNLARKYVSNSLPMADLRSRLQRLPTELHDLYKHILTEVVDQKDLPETLLLFQWVCLAHRPISITELRYAMVIEDSALSNQDQSPDSLTCEGMSRFIDNDASMASRIIALSGDLLEVRHSNDGWTDVVQISHQSVADFMIEHGLGFLASVTNFPLGNQVLRSSLSSEDVYVDIKQALETEDATELVLSACYERMFMACLSYLMFEEPDWSKHPSSRSPYLLQDQKPFTKHAAVCMFSYASKSQKWRLATYCHEDDLFELLSLVFDCWVTAYRVIEFTLMKQLSIGTTLFHMASEFCLDGVVCVMLPKVDVNHQNAAGKTALHYASQQGHLAIVRILLENRADPNITCRRAHTPLMDAVAPEGDNLSNDDLYFGLSQSSEESDGRLGVVKLLVGSGADVNHVTSTMRRDAGTALNAAAWRGYSRIVQFLLEKGAKVNTKAGRYGTALAAAARSDHRSVIISLLKAGASIDVNLDYGHTAIHMAALGGHEELFHKLFHASNDVKNNRVDLCTLINHAARGGNTNILKFLIKTMMQAGHNPRSFDEALLFASRKGYTTAVILLLEAGANCNFIYPHEGDMLKSTSSLLQAAWCRHEEVLRVLIEAGANVNHQYKDGETPLLAAIRNEDERIVWLLLEAGAEIDENESTFKLLLEAGTEISTENIDGLSPNLLASNRSLVNILKMLVHRRAS